RHADEHIGNLKIGNISHRDRISDLVTVIGNKKFWGKGIATEAIQLGNQIAFNALDIRKLSGGMYSGNIGSIKCYTNAGWKIEAILKGHHLKDGKVFDR